MEKQKQASRRWWRQHLRELEQFLSRISREPRDRLAWVVTLVQRGTGAMTRGDRANLQGELAAFLSLGVMGLARESLRPGATWSKALRKISVVTPLPDDIPGILMQVKRMIGPVVKRQRILLEERTGPIELLWNTAFGRWYPCDNRKLNMADLAAHALTPLILDYGHLVKECPAPGVRAKSGETCGLWFVAKRPNQDYCSATCQSRASTRAKRAGTPTPAALKRRAKEG